MSQRPDTRSSRRDAGHIEAPRWGESDDQLKERIQEEEEYHRGGRSRTPSSEDDPGEIRRDDTLQNRKSFEELQSGHQVDPDSIRPSASHQNPEGNPVVRPLGRQPQLGPEPNFAGPLGFHATYLDRGPLGATSGMHHDNGGRLGNLYEEPLPRGKQAASGHHSPNRGSTQQPPIRNTPTIPLSAETYAVKLWADLHEAEDNDADPLRIDRLRARAHEAQGRLDTGRVPIGTIMAPVRNETREAHDILRALNNSQPRPKLGEAHKKPTPQQVDQWVKAVENVFQMAVIPNDSATRTRWAIGTIQYQTHSQLLLERLNSGPERGWQWVKDEEQSMVQDPVLTKYENYVKFFNFQFRDSDDVNEFLSQLSKKESLLPRSFFKTPEGADDHEAKIAYVWSKIPDLYRREMQRQGNFQLITTWEEFERCLLNAEAASRPLGGATTSRGNAAEGLSRGGKRSGYQSDQSTTKKVDRRPSNGSGRSSPSRHGGGAHRGNSHRVRDGYGRGYDNHRGNNNYRRDNRQDDRRDNRQNDCQDGSRDEGKVNGRQEHWKNRPNAANNKTPEAGKGNP
jgi:hypothetical protein